jgi:hypothetical protein
MVSGFGVSSGKIPAPPVDLLLLPWKLTTGDADRCIRCLNRSVLEG